MCTSPVHRLPLPELRKFHLSRKHLPSLTQFLKLAPTLAKHRKKEDAKFKNVWLLRPLYEKWVALPQRLYDMPCGWWCKTQHELSLTVMWSNEKQYQQRSQVMMKRDESWFWTWWIVILGVMNRDSRRLESRFCDSRTIFRLDNIQTISIHLDPWGVLE